jgi:serine/threonine-protein kinase
MEKKPPDTKSTSAAKAPPDAMEDLDTILTADNTVDPVNKGEQANLGATEVHEQSDDEADAAAAEFLCEAPKSVPPAKKPAASSKPGPAASSKPGPAAKSKPNPAANPKPGPAAKSQPAPPAKAKEPVAAPPKADELGQTADFSEGPDPDAPPVGDTAVVDDSCGEAPARPKPTGTRAPGAGAKGVTQGPGAGNKAMTQGPGAGSPASSKALQRTAQLGDYRLVKKLGAGGMGTVYLADQVSLERKVALKVLSKDLASKPAFVQRFQREARLMAKLDHPNILRCLDVGEVAGHHFLAMEFVEGGSLQDWLKKLGKFSVGDAVHVAIACARALEHAHELKMIHRDIKPDNLLLTGKGVVKLADLGLAKAQDDDLSLTKTGTGAGTPLYMAPEQARDVKHVDHRSDIYSVGCMLYCFLTGTVPFTGETLVEVISAKEKGKFTGARRTNPEIPPRLDLIIDKLIAANPNHRYQNCTELLKDLEGLGVANQQLSFFGSTEAPAPKAAPGSPPPKSPTQKPQRAAARTATPESVPEGDEASADGPEGWYLVLPLPGGKTTTQSVQPKELAELIKNGNLTADTKVSRTPKGARRPAAHYPELNQLLMALNTKAKADKKGQKYRQLYAEIEEEGERNRRRKRWKQFFSRLLGGAGFLIWLVLILALLAGLAYGVYWWTTRP